jgi:hypothetical protein
MCERIRHLITSWQNAQQVQLLANIAQPVSQQVVVWTLPFHLLKTRRGLYVYMTTKDIF